MKAAVLKAFGSPLAIETMPEPVLGTGEVIVDVAASGVLAYANEVFSGERKYLLELPVVPGPGAIGRVRATGPDATRLRPGDWVYCDPTVRSRDNARVARHPPAGLDRRRAKAACACSDISATAHGPSRCGCRPKTPCRSAPSSEADAAPLVRAGHAAGALWRFSCRQPAGRRDRAGQRRHRQFRQRRRSPSRWPWARRCVIATGPQRAGAGGTGAAVRLRAFAPCRCSGNEADDRAAHPAGGARPDRLRAGYPAARGHCRAGADRRHGGAALRTRGADGRCRHARRRRARTALPLDDAKLHHASRPMDVPAARGHADGRH